MKQEDLTSQEAESQDGDDAAEMYMRNCAIFDVPIDPSIVIALRTKWDIIMPSKTFGEGGMLPLLGVLEGNKHIRKMNLCSAAMWDGRLRGAGNGNSNARVLSDILSANKSIKEVNLSDTGLDDDGMTEICRALDSNDSVTKLDISRNIFTENGAKMLTEALARNSKLKELDLSRNALGFQAISSLQCACATSGLLINTSGNYVFEEIMNAVSHGVGFIGAVIGSTLLMSDAHAKGTDYHFWAAALFSFSLMFLFLFSTLYHSFFMVPSVSWILQIFDHVGIYLLIAGSYTPFMLIGMHHSRFAQILLVLEWSVATIGSIVATVADLNKPMTNVVECIMFVGMGSAVLFLIHDMAEVLPSHCITLILSGGIAYGLGITFYVLGEFKPIFHVFWHCVVVCSAAAHWFAVYWYVLPLDLDHSQQHSMETLAQEASSCLMDHEKCM